MHRVKKVSKESAKESKLVERSAKIINELLTLDANLHTENNHKNMHNLLANNLSEKYRKRDNNDD